MILHVYTGHANLSPAGRPFRPVFYRTTEVIAFQTWHIFSRKVTINNNKTNFAISTIFIQKYSWNKAEKIISPHMFVLDIENIFKRELTILPGV